MDGEEEENGLFNINLSDSESESSSPNHNSNSNSNSNEEKHPRDYQSPSAFAAHKESWTAKVETGQIWQSIELPTHNPSKPESQTILHAVEELYFFGNYEKALEVVRSALEGDLEDGFRKTVEKYRVRCEVKLGSGDETGEKRI